MHDSEMAQKREYFVSEPNTKAEASIIWLHGLGADGQDFVGIIDQLGLPTDHKVRFIFPNAPFRNITINNGMLMRGWYDIFDLTTFNREDNKGIQDSQKLIEELVDHEIRRGIAARNILLAGFSQGGAMALFTSLNFKQTIGGTIVLSAYLPLLQKFDIPKCNQQIPIFMAHGMFDPVVPYNLGLSTNKFLEQQGCDIEWHTYPIQHTVCTEEIVAIGKFIRRCLGYA